MSRPTEWEEVSSDEVLRATVRRQFRRYRKQRLRIQAYDLRTTVFRDVIDLFLGVSGCAEWVWCDSRGREEVGGGALGALGHIAAELIFYGPLTYIRNRWKVAKLGRAVAGRASLGYLDRVLYVRSDHIFGLASGGAVAHVNGVINGLREQRLEVQVVSSDVLPQINGDSDFHIFHPTYALVRNIPELPRVAYNSALEAFIEAHWEEWAPSVIYNRYSMHSYIGPALKKRYGVPFVCEYNGSFVWMNRNWSKRRIGPRGMFFETLGERIEMLNLRAADLVVVVSSALKQEIVARGVEPGKVLVNPNAVDPAEYHPDIDGEPVRRTYGLIGRLVVGFIGTFGPWHGAEVLVQAAARLFSEGTPCSPEVADLHFLLIGDGVRMREVRRIIEEQGLEGRVTLTGQVPQEQGPAHLAACDILASPHVPNPDGTPFFGSPTKLFEYMAMGRAIVASDLDQIGDVLEHDETAVLVEPGDAEALAEGVRALARDPERRARLGRRAREVAERHHTWHQHSRRILEALRDVVPEGPATERA